jgi:hypothetical protein
MENIKIKVADWDKVSLSYETRERNENRCYANGVDSKRICVCCGKEIKNMENVKHLHLIEGAEYWTEYEGTINESKGADMGWCTVGPTCYQKYKKNEYEVEIVNKD